MVQKEILMLCLRCLRIYLCHLSQLTSWRESQSDALQPSKIYRLPSKTVILKEITWWQRVSRTLTNQVAILQKTSLPLKIRGIMRSSSLAQSYEGRELQPCWDLHYPPRPYIEANMQISSLKTLTPTLQQEAMKRFWHCLSSRRKRCGRPKYPNNTNRKKIQT